MISQANIKWISQVSGVTVEEISGALTNNEEVTLDMRLQGRVISQEEEKALKESAIQQGKEIGFKDIAKESGLSLDSGEKDAKIIAEKLKNSISTILEDKYKNPKPEEKERELLAKIEAEQLKYNKLLQTHESTTKVVEEWQNKYQEKEKEIKTKEYNNSILKTLPDKINYNRDHALIIIKNILQTEDVDGKTVYKRDNKIITDSVGNPESLENIIPALAEEFKWVKGSGMGGDDRPPKAQQKGGKTAEEAHKYIAEKLGAGNVASQEGLKLFKELTAKIE